MRKFKIGKLTTLAFVLVALVAGCGREQTTSPVLPTVIVVSPANAAVNVPLNTLVSAGFNSLMAPATINATTFTLTGPGAVAVSGAVTYSGTTATFTPAAPLAALTLYVATITTGATDPGGNALAVNFVWSFTTGPPTVISTIPAAGATAVPVNTLVSATFSEPMNPATFTNASFTLTGPGLTPVAGVVSASGSTATFTPSAVLATSTLYTATITTGAQDPLGVALAANFVWTFTTAAPPTVVSTVPADAATGVAVNTLISATFSGAMNPTTITGATFTVTGPGLTPVAGAVTYSGNTATFTPSAVLANSTLYTATITVGAKDSTGAPLAANFVWTFTTAAPPTVVSTVPADAATAVAVNTLISATFSGAMDPTTINAATFTVTGPGLTPVAGAVTYSGTTATFTQATNLAKNTVYTATITTGAKDLTGAPLAANFVWTFTTVPPLPTVTSTAPVKAATNVALNQKVAATFSIPMNAATILAPGTFSVAVTTGGAAVPGVVTYNAPSRTAIFTPTAALTASTQYTATVTTTAQSVPGDAMAANYVWSFTTGVSANATAPTVISTDPASAAVGVPLNQKIAATFSRPMDPATISALGTYTLAVTAGGAPVPGTVSYANGIALFTPTASLTASTQYTATITTAAQDLTGVAMAANFVWSFTTGTTANLVAPTITITNPADTDTAVPLDHAVNATFSTSMDPTTISSANFTLHVAGAGGASVDGTVNYDSASHIATFTPSANLAASTQYTATVSASVTDLSGNALAAGVVPNPWSFTTGTTAGGGASPATINLGSAGDFAVMATSSISSTGSVVINGDVGLAPGTSQGIPPAQVNGTIHVNDPVITQAQADLLAAYNDAVSRSANAQTLPGNMGGLTFTPGLYVNSTSVLISGAGPNNNVTLDAQGDPNAVFIFKMGSTLTTGTASQVILAGGAKAANVFWQVGTSATIDTTSIFKGNVLAAVSITINTGAVVEGNMFAGSAGGAASATINASSITVPTP